MTTINTQNISQSINNDSNYYRKSFTISTESCGYVSRELCEYIYGNRTKSDNLFLHSTLRSVVETLIRKKHYQDNVTLPHSLAKLIGQKANIRLITTTVVDLLLSTHFFSDPEVREFILSTNYRRESFTMSTDMEGSGYASRELSSYLLRGETNMETILLPITRKSIEQQIWRRIMKQPDFVYDEDSGGDTNFHWLPAKLAAFMGRDPEIGILGTVIVHTIVTYHFFLEPEVYKSQPLIGRTRGDYVWDEKTSSMVLHA
jgi:hypothetical protein